MNYRGGKYLISRQFNDVSINSLLSWIEYQNSDKKVRISEKVLTQFESPLGEGAGERNILDNLTPGFM